MGNYGYEFLKKKRLEMGYSFKDFSNAADISASMLNKIESGKVDLSRVCTARCTRMLKLLDISVPEFFDMYYPYESETDRKMMEWREKNPTDYSFAANKKRVRLRLFKIKERNILPAEAITEVFDIYNSFFADRNVMNRFKDKSCVMSEEEYSEYVRGINYVIMKNRRQSVGDVTDIIADRLYRTDYSIKDICSLSGIVNMANLSYYLEGKWDIRQMRILCFLKICYILNIDFDKDILDIL